MSDIVIISLHERGFWCADFWQGYGDVPADEFEQIAPSPDGYLSRPTMAEAESDARMTWPEARIEFAQEDEDGSHE
jgi:hypothetical protein